MTNHVHEWRGQRAKVCACGVSPDQECRKGHSRAENSYRNDAGKWCCRPCRNSNNINWRATMRTPEQHEAYKEQMRANAKNRHRTVRQQVLDHYGTSCACCGEQQVEFLCIDHVNNDGSAHRKAIKGKSSSGGSMLTYRWLVNNGFPDGFQTLCHNCNYAKHVYKTCPHQKNQGVAT